MYVHAEGFGAPLQLTSHVKVIPKGIPGGFSPVVDIKNDAQVMVAAKFAANKVLAPFFAEFKSHFLLKFASECAIRIE